MARERNLHGVDEGRWPASPNLDPAPDPDPGLDLEPDPLGRLDDVIATLEDMIHRGGGEAAPPARGTAGPESPETPDRPAGGLGDPGTIPLLRDMVPPAADDAPSVEGAPSFEGGVVGEPEAAGLEDDEPAPGRAPPEPRFQLLPEEPVFPAGVLGLVRDPADLDAGGERYGDAPPPSLDPEVYRQLVERLASEIDVIVQTSTEAGVKEALQRATVEIKRASVEIAVRVREHLAITLPEIIGEIVRTSRRPDD